MSNSMMDARPERLHGLDALRGFALLLGVGLHLSMSWLPGAQYWWLVGDADPSLALSGLFWWVHCFRMLTFFVLAGFFGRMLRERIGTAAFIRDRFRRIVLPLVVAWPLVFTAIIIVVVWIALLKFGGELPKESPPGPKFTPHDFPLTHLWFLYVLTLCYAAMLALRSVIAWIDRRGHATRAGDALMRLLTRPGAVVLLAAPLALALSSLPKWPMWFGIPTPDQSLYPNIAATVAFGSAFLFGWLLQRQSALLAQIAASAGANLAMAVAASLACLAIVGLDPSQPVPHDAGAITRHAGAYALAGWSWTLALIGLALRFLDHPSAARRYVADASYWVYLVHLPIVMALQVAMGQLDWAWWIEYPLALAVGLALMSGSYQLFVRNSFIGAALNGRRRRPPAGALQTADAPV
jgi:peptidoglycan/LPS O-acetylase OafA/YrhL